jgi:hypothetical protein
MRTRRHGRYLPPASLEAESPGGRSRSGSLAMLAAIRRASSQSKLALPFASDCAMMRARGQSSLRLIGCVPEITSPGRPWPGYFHCEG